MEITLSTEIIALASTFIGAGGLKLIEKFLNRDKVGLEEKQDYRQEIAELRARLDAVEAEVDAWKDKYYQSEEYISRLRGSMINGGMEPPRRRHR